MATLNYAVQYATELAQAYPYVLNFGALYSTENNGRYRWGEDGKTIYIPRISTTGRVDSDRDTIAMATRNYDNAWEPKTLSHQRKWSTLVHEGHRPDKPCGFYRQHHPRLQRGTEVPRNGRIPDFPAL